MQMKRSQELHQLLLSIDRRGYPAYKEIRGDYDFGKFILSIDHVQADPYAPPSRAYISMKRSVAGIPGELLDTRPKIIAVADFLTRAFQKAIHRHHSSVGGTGKSGMLTIDSCGQEILERTSVLIQEDRIEARFEVGLPAAGRRVMGKAADRIFTDMLPKIAESSLLYRNLDQAALLRQITGMLDQEYIRKELKQRKLVAFVADRSILPRESGVSDRPLPGGIPFQRPESLAVRMNLPSGKTVTGMGIPEGITLIVGGGYHGKSTVLKALERGIYPHIPGDGRELVVTREDAVKIRAEDGRSLEKVNISPFINHLPGNKDTHAFTTENASGSTSQAANAMEALEAGSRLLLFDEDTSATNFMIRDERMRKLVSGEKEPITPFIDKVRPMYQQLGVSTVLIVGGSGDYFDVADHIIMMDEYLPKDVTDAAKRIAAEDGSRGEWGSADFGEVTPRIPLKASFSFSGKQDRLKSKGRHTILYGREAIDLSGLEQLVDSSQTNAIAVMLDFFRKRLLDDKMTLSQAADLLYEQIGQSGLDSVSPYTGHPGNLALPRKQEFCFALNRYRGLKVKIK